MNRNPRYLYEVAGIFCANNKSEVIQMRNYDRYLDKLVSNSIEAKGYLVDLLAGVKGLSGKLDTLIALETAVLGRLQQPQEPQ